ncbi:hypothetical protein H2248_012184 [Termitomyces sp. 'cryptogamus']|nr:hypothetical protein H2248_012184 [Termitomyces sp. 'cryptogamus']
MAVLEALQVAQADVTPERFAEVVGQARGPPILEWCQTEAPVSFKHHLQGLGLICHLSVLSALAVGSIVSLRSQHRGPAETPLWHMACMAEEQGWDMEWVVEQLLEGRKEKVSGWGSGVEHGGSSPFLHGVLPFDAKVCDVS